MRLARWCGALGIAALVLTASLLAAENGQELFQGKCAMCHGADGRGNTRLAQKMGVKDLRAPEVQKESDTALSEAIAKGKGKMPPQASKLTKEQMTAVVSYVRDLAKQK